MARSPRHSYVEQIDTLCAGDEYRRSKREYPTGFADGLDVVGEVGKLDGRIPGGPMSETAGAKQKSLPRLVGINHVALEVGNIEAALTFYAQLFDLKLRGREGRMEFVDIGDQFLALSEGRTQPPDRNRHFGLVVDDKAAVQAKLQELGVEILSGSFADFRDPWGNHVQIIGYSEIQFSKTDAVLKGMGLANLEKSADAKKQLRDKGMGS